MNSTYDKNKKLKLLDQVGFRQHFKAECWEDFNRQFFDGLAAKYDRLNEVLSFGQHKRIKRSAIRMAGIRPGFRILDVCTGSGDIAFEIAKKYPACEVTAVDASQEMLKHGRRKCEGLKNVTFQAADALRLPFEDHSFDVTIISFGLRNLEDLDAGLKEMIRVTKPGGRFVNLDLGRVKGRLKKTLYGAYFLKFIPFLGRTIFHRGEFNSFQYLPESGKYFPSQEQLTETLQKLGLKAVLKRDFLFGAISLQIGSVAEPSPALVA